MKFVGHATQQVEQVGRAPQGARGLKFVATDDFLLALDVAPRKGRVG